MIKTYWNKNIPPWTLPTTPPSQNKIDRRCWIKFTIGKNEYYGKKLNSLGKIKIVVLKIIPLFLLSITLAPISIPLLVASGAYRKLGKWIREVHYSKTIKYIVNISNDKINKSQSYHTKATDGNNTNTTDGNINILNNAINPFGVPNEIALELLSSVTFEGYGDARRYFQTLSCVSKSLQPFIEKTKLNFINSNIISLYHLFGEDLDKALLYIKTFKSYIKNLNLKYLNLSDTDAKKFLSIFPKVSSLNFRGCYEITDKSLEEVAKLTSLTSLNLRSCHTITDEGLKEVAKLTSLTSLNLRGCHNITDEGSKEDAKLISLTSLNLRDCYNITDNGLKEVAKLTSLTSLNLRDCYNITDNGLKEVAKLDSLTSLNLAVSDSVWQEPNNVTDEGLKEIAKLTSLTSLNLKNRKKITIKSLNEVKKSIPSLQYLKR